MSIVIAGFLLGISIIVAIGPQNALIIRQGIKREAVGAVVAVCLISDILLIFGGTAGVGAIIERAPIILTILKYAGASYLAWFGLSCFRDAFKPKGGSMVIEQSSPTAPVDGASGSGGVQVKVRPQQRTRTWTKPVLAALAFTWLNPAAYIDALIMLGGMANQYGTSGRWYFATGALIASVVWFPLIGFGSSYFSHILAKPSSWRIINAAIGCIMAVMCVRLLMH
ncbi:LysE/ArgO family amino acid transporter [Corynebacterium sp. ES2794-CONJ1]|uniref:LysE/ArgO family amino acid transporter n=1 Tax=unclassified Corynebacterium TaxID=2624378 RepID=UPI002167CE0B|nr:MULTISPECIES: LysE/ArgO family amino acid transporter [unclassified Corynebacterium]MCS4489786.1 LysE/ArgO family amino acid transporter [Corynebacterium sp. ES2775-CONJ]MCS4491850.1 LysE/ArgO family amino acid transporter [Corynebacterium sp. ES2715-CONJ3]MCS4531955.1 LysE/ArgO family amino acid transporter [Corynebacterium sp. ES2730-CONJ]MCU9519356.1 LysE/ArgO family amino acid transporter [Corynebacterium sp. ES2794-CONJ1]